MLKGATREGTQRYAQRLARTISPEHFREQQSLCVSTIGLGTYLGRADERTDRMYQESIRRAIELGCNVIDSAINYRFQRSERAIGAALKQLFASGKTSRDEIVVATKGGFFSFLDEMPRDASRWVRENLIDTGVASPDDIVDSHCMSPTYLANQLNRSLVNLELEKIDIYYIHNPESQLDGVQRDEFMNRIRRAFEFLETAAGDGRIGVYGTATWNGFRQQPKARDYLSLADMEQVARQIGGAGHHFRAIQLPFNLGMPEALTLGNQLVDGEQLSIFEAAANLGISVICSSSISQAKLTQGLPGFVAEAFGGLASDAQRAIQFARSAPGATTALVGMSQRSHVEENMMVARIPPAPIDDFLKIFSHGQEA